MHLSDQALLELDASGKIHLEECEHCRKRAENLRNIRQKLNEMPQASNMQNRWQQTKQAYFLELKERETEQANKKVLFWRNSSLALAASLLLMVLWQYPIGYKEPAMQIDSQLSSLIAHNQLLQKEFEQISEASLSNVNLINLKHELSLIDQALQNAYLKQLSDEEKAKLWQQRHALMKKMLLEREKRKVMVI